MVRKKEKRHVRDMVGATNKSVQQNTESTGTAQGLKSVDLGLDISTSTIGVVLLDNRTGKLEKMFAIKLTSTKLKDFYDKVDRAVSELVSNIDLAKYDVQRIYVEEAAKKFTPGFSSAGTLFLLARFNGIISNEARKIFGPRPKMINVRSARKELGIKIDQKDKSKDTKTKVFEAVRALNPKFPWTQHKAKTGRFKGQIVYSKQNQDIADAWVICRGGQIIDP